MCSGSRWQAEHSSDRCVPSSANEVSSCSSSVNVLGTNRCRSWQARHPLENGPFSTEEFVDCGEQAVLFLHVTSHVKADPDQNLLEEKGGRGFPHLVVMDDLGNGPVEIYRISIAQVPEPATLALFGMGLAGLFFAKRRRGGPRTG